MTVFQKTRLGAMVAALLALAFLSGCSFNAYLDKQAPEIRAEDIRKPGKPAPVQLSVAVSGGAVQGDATADALKIVEPTVRSSGLFSEVSSQPVASGARLEVSLQINEGGAAPPGVDANQLTVVSIKTTLRYARQGRPDVLANADRSLFVAMGEVSSPRLRRAASLDAGFEELMKQSVLAALQQLANDASFAR